MESIMRIYGLQKLTLLDYPGKIAATVFTSGCNMRCPFCHNADLVLGNIDEYPMDKLLSFFQARKSMLEGICITGGEPLINSDIRNFILTLKDMGYSVKLDTNGSLPDRLAEVIDSVDYVAIDIKNSPSKYPYTIGLERFDIAPLKRSIELVMNKAKDYEFRTTVIKGLHTIEDIESCASLIKGAKKYYLQKFIDSGKLLSNNSFSACRNSSEIFIF